MNGKLYATLASLVTARANCEASGNDEWYSKHSERIVELVKELMPSGSGIDCGTKLDLTVSDAEKLVFITSYHHMDEAGGYDGWTEHTVIVTPSLQHGFNLRITGRDRNGIKEYLYDVFSECLNADNDCWAGSQATPTNSNANAGGAR